MAESNVGDMANVAGGLWNRYANVVNNDEGIEKVADVVKDVYDHIHEVDYNEENKTLFSYLSKLRFSYRVDPSEPSLLSYVNEIFKKSEDIKLDHEKYYRNYFTIMEEDNNYSNSYYLDDSRSFAKDVATGFNVEGCYGAFCLGALMSADKSSSSSYRTARYESSTIIEKYICFTKGEFKDCPTEYLTTGFMETVKRYSDPEDLEEHLGTFYAWKIKLGGCIKKSFVMEISKDDNQENIKAELKAGQFGSKLLGLNLGSAGSRTEYTKRQINKKASIKMEMRTKGGKPELWLAESDKSSLKPSNSESIKQQWANSFDNTNLYPIAYTLKPIWELVKKLDQDKGERFEVYLKDKWEKNEVEIGRATFLNSKRVSSLENIKEILRFCKDYAETCEEQEVKAQNKLDIFSFIICFSKRFEHWKEAGKNGRKVFTQLIDDINNPEKTIKQFREFVEEESSHFRIHAEENKGPYWSELYKKHAEKLMEVFKMVEEGKVKRKLTKVLNGEETSS